METRDYTKYLPEVADECVRRWAEEHNWGRELLVYRTGWWRDPLTGKKEKCVDATCSVCGKTTKLPYAPGPECSRYAMAPFGFFLGVDEYDSCAYQTGNDLLCPRCGAQVEAAHVSGAETRAVEYEWVMEPGRIPAEQSGKPDLLVLMFWRVKRWISKQAIQCLMAEPWEAYIVEEKKMIRCAHWNSFMGHSHCQSPWRQCRTFRDEIRHVEYMVGENVSAEDLEGTVAENSKLDLYMQAGEVRFPVAYLRLWQRHRNVETLLTAGVGDLLAGMICEEKKRCAGYCEIYSTRVPELGNLNWKAKRPGEILRTDREGMRWIRRCGLTANGLMNWMAARASGADVKLLEDIEMLNREKSSEAEKVFRFGQRPDRARRYVETQKRRYPKESGLGVDALTDYWNMAEKLGIDLSEREAMWPANLMRAHDQMMQQLKFKENEKLRGKFEKRRKELERYCFEAGGLMIRPPADERELIVEGKVLDHCVATYAESHAKGSTTILFIRRKEETERPFFTLSLNKEGDRVIQNHGRKNCMQTPEVKAFEERWMAWQLAGCKRDKQGRPVEPVKEKNTRECMKGELKHE